VTETETEHIGAAGVAAVGAARRGHDRAASRTVPGISLRPAALGLSWLQIQRSGVRFQALVYYLGSGWSGTGSTQPREYN
jgi:hypothetical protein